MNEELFPPQPGNRRRVFRLMTALPLLVSLGACNGDPFPASSTTASTAPTITTEPTSITVTAGLTATFTVVASGTAPLSYQWSSNNVAISGATQSSYSFVASASDSGTVFTVTVTNSFGSVTSNGATLTVQ